MLRSLRLRGSSFGLLLFFMLMVAPPPACCQQLGINLAGVHDWNSELPFVDFFHLSRAWVSQEKGKPWGKGPTLDLDEKGWIKRLSPGGWAETCLLNIRGGHYPHGTYTLNFAGRGKIDINNVDGAFKQKGNVVEFEVTGDEGIIWIQIKETDPADYIRNIQVYPPGTSGKDGLLRRGFLDRWQGVKAVRFMEFMEVNNSVEQHWQQRAAMDDAAWTIHGAPVEVAVAIANSLHAAPWFSIPHLADDDYVRHFAQLVKEQLDPKLAVYLEYSNETWNPMFNQTQYCREQGVARRLSSNPVEAGHRYAVMRSLEIFHIWEEVFGGSKRLVRVIAGQAANPAVNEERLTYQQAWRYCDTLAVAPYITLNVSKNSMPPLAEVRTWSLARLEQELATSVLAKSTSWMASAAKAATRYGVQLIAYEGGQHLVGIQGAENDDQLTRLFLQANRSPQMGRLYDLYLDEWRKVSSDGLFCLWLSTEIWSRWGSWGLAEYYDEAPESAPKLKAVFRRIKTSDQFSAGAEQ